MAPPGPRAEHTPRLRRTGPGQAYAVWLVRQHRKGPAVSEPDDSLRVSDAERDAVLHTLGDHAAVGRLTLDELEDRSSRALAAKTRGELATLTSDLPADAEG